MDKILNGVKDFGTIKRYLEAINQTTDDFLFVYDNRIRPWDRGFSIFCCSRLLQLHAIKSRFFNKDCSTRARRTLGKRSIYGGKGTTG